MALIRRADIVECEALIGCARAVAFGDILFLSPAMLKILRAEAGDSSQSMLKMAASIPVVQFPALDRLAAMDVLPRLGN